MKSLMPRKSFSKAPFIVLLGVAGMLFYTSTTACIGVVRAEGGGSVGPSQSTLGAPSTIAFEPASPSVLPGQRLTIKVTTLDSSGVEIHASKILSADVVPDFKEYLQVSHDEHTLTVIGLSGPAGPSNSHPTIVPVIVKSGTNSPQVESVLNVRLGTTAPPAGPIPTSEPQVDVMWEVYPKKIVRDNFGRRVSDQYYCIHIVIGNNSGYSLQLASVGFTVPFLNTQAQNSRYTVPAASYQMTRGTLIREQQTGFRTELINGLTSFGPILTGLVPFYHAPIHRSNFSQFVNVFSNPVTAAFNLVIPDTITGHLVRLENQSFKNDNQNSRTIIENNTQYDSVTFFPRHFLDGYFSKKKASCTNGDTNQCKNPDDPADVMEALGQMVLIGEQVQFLNRISFNSRAAATNSNQQFSVSGRVTECGQGVPKVTVKLTGDSPFADRTTTTDGNGNYKFDGLPGGVSYQVEPQAGGGVTFPNVTPSRFTLNSDMPGVDFQATLSDSSYVIEVQVVDERSQPVSGLDVKLDGSDTKPVEIGGVYIFTGLGPGSRTVTIEKGTTTFKNFSPKPPLTFNLNGRCHVSAQRVSASR